MKKCFFTIATQSYEKDFQMLEKSFKHFHPNEELIRFSDSDTNAAKDPDIFYRGTPYFAKKLFDQGYDEVCHLDADMVITGSLDDVWLGDYDAAVVLNNPAFPIQAWDISPYVNNGLNVFKSKDFVEHWLRLCYSHHFNAYSYKEQDLLTILASDYHNYKIRWLDLDSDKIYGEWAKPFWSKVVLEGEGLFFETPLGKKDLRVIHFAGGAGDPSKGNYKIRFTPEVTKFIDGLVQ